MVRLGYFIFLAWWHSGLGKFQLESSLLLEELIYKIDKLQMLPNVEKRRLLGA